MAESVPQAGHRLGTLRCGDLVPPTPARTSRPALTVWSWCRRDRPCISLARGMPHADLTPHSLVYMLAGAGHKPHADQAA